MFPRLFRLLSMALSLPFCGTLLNEQINVPTQKQITSIDPTDLDLIFFRSAVSALFKAKADTILSSLPRTERIVYRQCESDSNGRLNMLAKCVVSLFQIRDFRFNSNSNRKLADHEFQFSEVPWISAISKKLLEGKTEKKADNKKEQKSEKEVKEKTNKLKKNLSKLEEILGRQKGGGKRTAQRKDEKVLREIGKPRAKRENKDHEAKPMEQKLKQYPHLQKLVRIERFYRLLEKCNEYIQRKDEDHSKFLQQFGMPLHLQTNSVQPNALFGLAQMQLRQSVTNDKLSILSPKLLSIIPDQPNQHKSLLSKIQHNPSCLNTTDLLSVLLSPSFFSFQEQGDLSLPSLLKLGLSNANETMAWLDFLLQISGASSTLDKLIALTKPAFEAVESRIHPAIVRLEELEERFRRIRMMENKKQRQEIAQRGYTFISREQSRIVLGQAEDAAADDDGLDEDSMEQVLENDIRMIARMDGDEVGSDELDTGTKRPSNRSRTKRFLRTEPLGQVRLLSPYFFANQLHDGAVLRRVALSPRAFSASVMSPDFGQLTVLSPRAFLAIILSPRAAIANILSPSALNLRLLSPQAFLAEVLSPKAFIARILSPRAMSAYVLSPRALITTILSPKALELRVLSPTMLAFTVLSPTIGGAKFASPQSFSMVVLSPNILSPSFLNKGTANIKVLSPSILSGGGGGGEK